MKEKIEYRYEFVNGDIVEVCVSGENISSEWVEVLLDLDRKEYNNNQTERRRHCSLDALNLDETLLATERDGFEVFFEKEMWVEMCKCLTERERLIGDLFFRQGYKKCELARIFGLSDTRIYQIIEKIKRKIRKFSKRT